MLKCYWADIALLEEPEVFAKWLEKVNAQRREKVLRCKNEKDRQRSLLAGILLRYALEEEGISYENAEFSKTKEGKPFLVSEKYLQFSISHAGEYAVCAVSDMSVGVDVECMDKAVFQNEKKQRLLSIAKKCFSETEWDRFETSPQKAEVFLEFWTKKEAYSKAVGKGLGMDFSSIDTETKRYWTEWLNDTYCISIYKENEQYEELFVKQIEAL